MSQSGFRAALARSSYWGGKSIRATPDASQQRIDLTPPRLRSLAMLGFGVVWLIATSSGLSELLQDPDFELIFVALFPLIGVGMIAWSLRNLLTKREAVFGRDGVEVTGHSLFGREKWQEAYSGYRGVLHREVRISHKNSPDTVYQIIELRHDEPRKTLPLLVEESTTMPRELWEAYAKWLKVPALTESGGEFVARDHEDLDKSVRELAAEGKIAPQLDFTDAPPPKGLYVAKESTHDGDQLRVTMTAMRTSIWVPLLVLGIPASICLLVAILARPIVGLGALVFAGLGVLWVGYDRRTQRQILITRARLVVTDGWQRRPAHEMSFDLGEIETITSDRAKGVTIAGDRTQVDIGSGLSQAAQVWLKDFLTSAVAMA